MRKYLIKKIFGPTIQGEGSHIGKTVSFVRFSGCNKWSGKEEDKEKSSCPFCDTDFNGGERFTSDEIVSKLKSLGTNIAILSGGEPTLQMTADLLSEIAEEGIEIHVETNGSRDIPQEQCLFIDHISLSPKQSIEETNLRYCDDLKILYPPIHEDITPDKFNDYDYQELFLQPVEDINYKLNLSKTINKCHELNAKLSPQLHKLIGVE